LLSLANGATTEKMTVGHHGANHPVQDLSSKQVMITSQNHGFSVSYSDMPSHLEWRAGLSDKILKGTHTETITAMFGLIRHILIKDHI
jgi:carbamoylphosphate synthase small subunit